MHWKSILNGIFSSATEFYDHCQDKVCTFASYLSCYVDYCCLGWSVGTKTTWQHSLLMLDDMEWWLGRSHKYPTPYNRVIPSLLSYYQIFKKFINANKETSLMIEFLVKNVTSIIVQKHKSKSRSRLFLDYSPLAQLLWAVLSSQRISAHIAQWVVLANAQQSINYYFWWFFMLHTKV